MRFLLEVFMQEQIPVQMTKEDYEAFIKQKRQELFDLKLKIALAASEDEKVGLKEAEKNLKRILTRAMQNNIDYGYYNELDRKGR